MYCLRYVRQGKRLWESVGSDPQLALTAKLRMEHRLQAVALGMPPEQALPMEPGETDLAESIAEYLADTKRAKAKNTFYAYARTLKVFASVCKKRFLEQVDRHDVLNYLEHLKASVNVPRTVSNYANLLKIFFRNRGVEWPLKKTDRIKYTAKVVSAYEAEDIVKLLAGADQEEAELFQFFLFTGARDREVQFATWSDVNFFAKTYTIAEKLDLGFTLKDQEEGVIPIPDT